MVFRRSSRKTRLAVRGGGVQFHDQAVEFIDIGLTNGGGALGIFVGHDDGEDAALPVLGHEGVGFENLAGLFCTLDVVDPTQVELGDNALFHGAAGQDSHEERARGLHAEHVAGQRAERVIPSGHGDQRGQAYIRLFGRHEESFGFKSLWDQEGQNQGGGGAQHGDAGQKCALLPEGAEPQQSGAGGERLDLGQIGPRQHRLRLDDHRLDDHGLGDHRLGTIGSANRSGSSSAVGVRRCVFMPS